MNKLIKFINLIIHPLLSYEFLRKTQSGYLYESGWVNSFLKKEPVDKYGNPVPWMTLSFNEFLIEKLEELKKQKELRVFEYGSGNSTLFIQNYVKEIYSVEYDELWFKKIKSNKDFKVSTNVFFADVNSSEYENKIIQTSGKFEIIIVDGRKRNRCVEVSINYLTNDGVLILDDSERIEYEEAKKLLSSSGFKKINFWGVSPGLDYKKCTSIFYKSDNFLNL